MTEKTESTIFVIEDDEAVRDSLKMMLESLRYRVEPYSRADDFLKAYSPEMAGCIVLDIRMPGMNGMELQRKLNDMNSILPIIFVTGHGDVPMAVEAMQQGAVDFVQKPYREQELLDKIQKAVAMDTRHRTELREVQQIRERFEGLTPREREVMYMMVEGKANKVIAIDMDISQRTVEIHRARVMEKMDCRSLAHLVRMALVLQDSKAD